MKPTIRLLSYPTAFAACLSFAGLCASGFAQAAPPPTSIETAVTHPTTGCADAVVQTPQPGTQFADPLRAAPASATSFYAKAASLNVTWLSTMDCTATGLSHALVPGLSTVTPSMATSGNTNTVYDSQNWSGYQINNTAHYVQGGYTIPTVVNPPLLSQYSTTGYLSSAWAGIGGGRPNQPTPLIQSGSTQQLSASNVASYYFWYEIVGGPSDTGGEIQISNLAAAPGDDIASVSLWIQSSGKAEMGICNFSQGVCLQFYKPNTPEPGATVEWIVEAPSVGGVPAPLADFGLVNFYNACWGANYTEGEPISCSPINVPGITSPAALWLYRRVFGCYQFLAIPQALSSDSSFTDDYQPPDRSACQ